MNVKEQAKMFALEAYKGQVRKSESDKPMIMHPMSVAILLESYGYDDNVVASGYLHDVIEDTNYTLDDIRNSFGEDIAILVSGASEKDKTLSWEKKKKNTIEECKSLPLRNKSVICAEKINILEDLFVKFEKSGIRDFSGYEKDENMQKWYYTSIYESLIFNENKELPIFKRLKKAIDNVFYYRNNLYLRDVIFDGNNDYYNKLKRINAQREELQRLKNLCNLTKPFIIEFSGTAKTGKTSTINNLYDFFNRGGFKVKVIEDFTISKYYQELLKDKFSKMTNEEHYIAIVDSIYDNLLNFICEKLDILLIENSINDRQIWNYVALQNDNMSQDYYDYLKRKYSFISKDLIDYLVITYAKAIISVKRDYNSCLSLDSRNSFNINKINNYNNSLKNLEGYLKKSVDNYLKIDTSYMSLNDIAIEVATNVMPVMRSKYIKEFKKIHKI